MTEHMVFSGAPPWEPSLETDGTPSIVTGVAFYSVATTWYVDGGRIRVPVGGSASLPATVTIELRTAATFALIDLSTAPVASAVANVADGWVEARWSPVELAAGTVAWISLSAGTAYLFVGVGTVGTDPIQADDGADLYLAEAGTTPGVQQPRSAFRIGTGSTTLSQAWYGIDIIVDDTAGGAVWDVSGTVSATSSTTGQVAARRVVAGESDVTTTAFATVTGGSDPNPLPIRGTLTATTPGRGITALTPRRGMEAA